MSFAKMAERTLGSHHTWSQDIYLHHAIDDPDYGACAALTIRWLCARVLASRNKLFPRETYGNYVENRGRTLTLQNRINDIPESEDLRTLIAQRMLPVSEELEKEGATLRGSTVTPELSYVSDFICENIGFFFIGLFGDSAHAIGAVHYFGDKIVLFDPNYGEVSWGHEGPYYAKVYAKNSFRIFLRELVKKEYADENYRTFLALHYGVVGR